MKTRNLICTMATAITVTGGTFFAQESKFQAWDTLMADLQIAEHLNLADSALNSHFRAVFNHYQVSSDAYRQFYDQFMQKPVREQEAFIDRVKTIVIERIKEKAYRRRWQYGGEQETKP